MKLIPSFQVDHTRVVPGIYVSRVDSVGDGFVTTFDVRMKRPNAEPAMHPNAMHTVEHVVATFMRGDPEWADRIVYWGPMGCLTGFYLLVKGRPSPQEVLPLVRRAFEALRDYEGEVPGATAKCCGNFRLHDLAMAKWEAARFVETLAAGASFEYPAGERTTTDGGAVFYDS